MARLPRVSPVGVAVHIIQRGNNRQDCFVSDKDYATYLDWLQEYSQRYGVDVHAWVLMSNHVHLLCTPRQPDATSQMMQSLGRRYVRYFNHLYQRTGTLWEGRYRSCLVQNERYLLEVYRYIELNPVRAKMVEKPAEYPWSSYLINAEGKLSGLCTPHPEYLAMGNTDIERLENYRALFDHYREDDVFLREIRDNTNRGLAVGHKRFKEEIEEQTGRRVIPRKRGRPAGWKKSKG